jgi:SOS-response transcriptional repressor LexA
MNERELIQRWISWKEDTEGVFFSQKKLADSAGISPTYLSSILTGARNAGTKTIERIAAAVGVSVSEFYGGPPGSSAAESSFPAPPPPRTLPDAPVNADVLPIESVSPRFDQPEDRHPNVFNKHVGDPKHAPSASDETGLKFAGASSEGLDRLFDSFGFSLGGSFPRQSEPEPEPPRFQPAKEAGAVVEEGVPLLLHAPPGRWREWLDKGLWTTAERIVVLLARSSHIFAVRMEDPSMSPRLDEGSYLIIDPEVRFTRFNGGIGVVVHEGRFKIRHIYAVGGFYILVPSNPAYYPQVIRADGAQVFRIALCMPVWAGPSDSER